MNKGNKERGVYNLHSPFLMELRQDMWNIVKMLSSDRTNKNGQINSEYVDEDKVEEEVLIGPEIDGIPFGMNEKEMRTYAKDMFGLDLHKNYKLENMVGIIYLHQQGKSATTRAYTKRTIPNVPYSTL